MNKELTPLQAFEQHKERFYNCAEDIMHRDFPFTKNNSYQEVMSVDVKNELAIIETALKENEKLKECYKNELKNSAYYNNLALKYKKAVEIIKENFDFIAMIKKASAQGLCNLQDEEYKLLEEILK